jgi:hypothetical protein
VHHFAGMAGRMAPARDMLELLHFLGRSPAQLTPRQASTCKKTALLAIGDHIERGIPEWLEGASARTMWVYVSGAASQPMSGPQLQALCCAMQEQRDKERQDTPEGRERELRVEEEGKVAACMEAAKREMVAHNAALAAGSRLLRASNEDAGRQDCRNVLLVSAW